MTAEQQALRAAYIQLEDFRLTMRNYDLRQRTVKRVQRRIAKCLTAAGLPVPALRARRA